MTDLEISKIYIELNNLLDSEKVALITGNFEKIETFHDRKQILSEILRQFNIDASTTQLSDLQKKAEYNDRLYEASLKGLKFAKARINELQATLGQLRVYDDGGFLTNKAPPNPSVSIKS